MSVTTKKSSLLRNSWTTFKSVKFVDIIGCDEAKEELRDIVSFLKNPTHLESLGGKGEKVNFKREHKTDHSFKNFDFSFRKQAFITTRRGASD